MEYPGNSLYFCSVNKQLDKKEILNKIWQGKTLTEEEEKFYLVEIVGLPEEEADRVMAINANQDPLVIID